MIITTDDLNQEDWSLFRYFDKLKEEFPKFKLIAFFTPFWQVKEKVDFDFSDPEAYFKPSFLSFLKERRDWLILGAHGLYHLKTSPDCYLQDQDQELMFLILRAIWDFLEKQGIKAKPHFKPPFYRFRECSLSLACKYGFCFFFFTHGVIDLQDWKICTRSSLELIDTHVSKDCPLRDRIDLIYEPLRKKLQEYYGKC